MVGGYEQTSDNFVMDKIDEFPHLLDGEMIVCKTFFSGRELP